MEEEEKVSPSPTSERCLQTLRKTIRSAPPSPSPPVPDPLTDDTQLDSGVPRGALVEVHPAPVQPIVRARGVVHEQRRRRTSGRLEVGTSSELVFVHPVRTLFKLCVPHIKAREGEWEGDPRRVGELEDAS